MRLRRALDSILDKRTKVKVLRVLISPGLELTGREVAAEAKVNHVAASRALGELAETGLVEVRRKGRAHLYQVRQENLLVRQGLRPLFQAERRLFWAVVELLRNRFERRVISAILFGTYARGEEDERSDLDVLFVVKTAAVARKLEEQLHTSVGLLRRQFGITLAPYVKSVAAFRTMALKQLPLAREIMRDGRLLFGRPLERL